MFIYTIGVLFSNDIGEKKGVDQYLNKVLNSTISLSAEDPDSEYSKEKSTVSELRFMVGKLYCMLTL